MTDEHAEKLTAAIEALTAKIEELCRVAEKVDDMVSSGIGMLGEDDTVLAIRSLPSELRETREALTRRT